MIPDKLSPSLKSPVIIHEKTNVSTVPINRHEIVTDVQTIEESVHEILNYLNFKLKK